MAGKYVDVTLRLIDQLSSPLNKAGQKLAEHANQWKRAGTQISRVGGNIAKVGGNMTKKITVPVLAADGAAIKLASDFEAGMSKVQSISGATSDELGKLADKAKEMGIKTKYSATEATEAYSYMAMAGWDADEMLAGISGTMYLAGATGEDLASVSDIVTDSLTAFKMKASDTNKFVDILAQTAANANTDVGKLGESFKYCAPIAGSMGYNVQDISVALGLMANSGIKASQAGTSMRSWISRLAKPTKDSQEAMDKLGLSLTDSNGKMKPFKTIMEETRSKFKGLTAEQKAQYAAMIAGKTGMTGLLSVVDASDSDFNKLTESIKNSNGACKKMYETANDNLNGTLTILKSTVQNVAISFGERLTPYVKKLTKWVQQLAEKFNSLTPAQQDTIIKIAGIAAAIGPAILGFGKMTKAVGNTIKMIAGIGKAFKVFGSVAGILTSPAGIVIGIIAAIALAAVLIYKNWDKLQPYFKKLADGFKSFYKKCKPVINSIVGGVKGCIKTIKGIIKELMPVIKWIWGCIKEFLGNMIGRIKTVISFVLDHVNNLIQTLKGYLDGIKKVISGIIDFVTGVFTGNWKKAWDGVKQIFSGAWDALKSIAKGAINGVIGIINFFIQGINESTVSKIIGKFTGHKNGIRIPVIPKLAKGTMNWKGGIAQISERGGEIVDLPKGSRVYPHDQSVSKAYNDGKQSGAKPTSVTIKIPKIAETIIVREEADIDKIVNKIAEKLEKVSGNLGGGELGYLY